MKDAAIGIIFSGDKVLLVKRRDVCVWVLPGGGIDDGESPEEAALREVKEETGLEACLIRKVGTWLPINRLASTTHVFECKAENTLLLTCPQECQDARFWPRDSLPAHTFFLHRKWIEQAVKQVPSGLFLLSELTYFRCLKIFLQHPLLSFRYLLSRMGLPLND